ncbi:MAG: anthranilate synthase component I family protein [Gemmatimonadales bacterium]
MRTAFDITADLDTPVSAYLKLASLNPCFLLESVDRGDRLGRYSFLGFGKTRQLRLDGQGLVCDGRLAPGPASLPEVLRRALALTPPLQPEVPSIPFGGGLVGVTTYEAMARIEPRLEGAHNSAVLQGTWVAPESMLVFDHVTRKIALLHAGDDADRARLAREVKQALRAPVAERPTGTVGPEVASFDKDEFCRAVDRVKNHITDGDVFQMVLSIRFEGETTVDPFDVYRALRVLNPSPYLFHLALPDLTVVGSSPEALVRLRGGNATLRPIAGTRPRGGTEADDDAFEQELLDDPKEAAEHVMLVDLARNDLGRVAEPGSIAVRPFRSVERYSHVMHLVTGVEGRLADPHDQFDLFAAAFPAGTVVGAPKVRAMELIAGLEPVDRGFYAGTAGYFGHGDSMDQAIAIRTMAFEEGRYFYQAGAGVVADSVPENEYAEVLAKSAALKAALALAAGGL